MNTANKNITIIIFITISYQHDGQVAAAAVWPPPPRCCKQHRSGPTTLLVRAHYDKLRPLILSFNNLLWLRSWRPKL